MSMLTAYRGRRVLITGHTGFKGSWLTIWLAKLGAHISGYSLAAPTEPSNFEVCGVEALIGDHRLGDVRDYPRFVACVAETQPDFIFHMAAQPLVRLGYADPRGTFEANVMGTVNLLEAVREGGRAPVSVIIVTSDKAYENREQVWGYRECDAMGGHDPYSASKGASEIAVASYRRAFFPGDRVCEHGVQIASVRAGNVIGGGDWAADRLVPDMVRAFSQGLPVEIRQPGALRPWQHVLEPLSGYLTLGAALDRDTSGRFADGWNFGPHSRDATSVGTLADMFSEAWTASGDGPAASWFDCSAGAQVHEARTLRLSIDKAVSELGWEPQWGLRETIRRTADWYAAFQQGKTDMLARCKADIADYEAAMMRNEAVPP